MDDKRALEEEAAKLQHQRSELAWRLWMIQAILRPKATTAAGPGGMGSTSSRQEASDLDVLKYILSKD
jgi:hypothetical protein